MNGTDECKPIVDFSISFIVEAWIPRVMGTSFIRIRGGGARWMGDARQGDLDYVIAGGRPAAPPQTMTDVDRNATNTSSLTFLAARVFWPRSSRESR